MSTSSSAFAAFAGVPPHWRDRLAFALAVIAGGVIPLLFIGRAAVSLLVPTIAVLTAIVLFDGHAIRRSASILRTPQAPILLALFTAWLVSALLSLKPGFSLSIWLQSCGLVLLIPALAAVLAHEKLHFGRALQALILVSLAGTVVSAIAIELYAGILSFRIGRSAGIAEARLLLKSYAAVMPCLAPLLIWSGFRLGGTWRWFAGVALILGAVIVIETGNRAAAAGYAGAAAIPAFVWLLLRASRPVRIAAAALLALAMLAGSVAVIQRLPSLPFRGEDSLRLPTHLVDVHRQVIWSFTTAKALERPVFGWGLSVVNAAPGAEDPVPFLGQNHVPLHPHNWALQLWAETGTVGLAAALAALAAWIMLLYRRAAQGSAVAWAGLAMSGAFFVSGLANFSIWAARWQAVFVIFAALVLADLRRQRARAEGSSLAAADGGTKKPIQLDAVKR